MTAALLKGAPIAAELRRQCVEVLETAGLQPLLANVVVGEDPAAANYLDALDRAAERRGILSRRILLPADVGEDALCAAVTRAGADPEIHGLMVQFPLPAGLSRERVSACIPPHKDVDGAHPASLGGLLAGRRGHSAPATAAAVVELLARDPRCAPAGRHAVLVGRSLVVGRPLAAMLAAPGPGGDATVTLCHTRTTDLARHTRAAEILVVAAGKKHLLTPDMVAPGAVVIDVGTHAESDGAGGVVLHGDVHPDVAQVAGVLTPVPGGVGPVTAAVLMQHVAALALPGRLPPAW